MLFSQPELAGFLNDSFECAWESVRPVPRVDIDFGNGVHLRRTLGGNVATWFCNERGQALDLVPGLVDARTFRGRAEAALALHGATRASATTAEERLARHHRERSARREPARPPSPAPHTAPASDEERLSADTRYNRTQRFPAAHALLAEHPLARPASLTKRVFREILDVDLEDPWLGLAPYVLGGEGGRTLAQAGGR